jgi:lysine 6-dehydrogenase
VGKNYAIIGSGRQGTASAYDLARYGEADLILLADSNEHQAEVAATRINHLMKANVAKAVLLDASDVTSVTKLLEEHQIDAFVAGTPYSLNLGLTQAAIQTRSGMTDLGGNSEVVHAQLDLNDLAKGAGISIVPDCGLGPGMTTTLGLRSTPETDSTLELQPYL